MLSMIQLMILNPISGKTKHHKYILRLDWNTPVK